MKTVKTPDIDEPKVVVSVKAHAGLDGLDKDDHPQYLLRTDAEEEFAAASHGHLASDISGIVGVFKSAISKAVAVDKGLTIDVVEGRIVISTDLEHGMIRTSPEDNDHPQYLLAAQAESVVLGILQDVLRSSDTFKAEFNAETKKFDISVVIPVNEEYSRLALRLIDLEAKVDANTERPISDTQLPDSVVLRPEFESRVGSHSDATDPHGILPVVREETLRSLNALNLDAWFNKIEERLAALESK